MPNLALFLVGMSWPIAKKVLQMLGIGWVSYEGVTALTNAVIGHAQANWGGVGGAMFQLGSLGGIPEVMGIISGALVARASFIVIDKLTKVATS